MGYGTEGYESEAGTNANAPKPSDTPEMIAAGQKWKWDPDSQSWVVYTPAGSNLSLDNGTSGQEMARVATPEGCSEFPGTVAVKLPGGGYACVLKDTLKTKDSGGGGSTTTTTSTPQPQAQGNYPTPTRMTMPKPTAPTPYSSTYQSTTVNPYTGYGEADRNRLMSAILQSPETMGQTQQAQLFEQQKELLNAQRQQQNVQLQQSLLQRGLSPTGGAALAGQAAANQDFTGQLLAAQRDIAVKAAQQNRADQLAALQMQEALASGDYGRMMGVYQANQQERMNTENFLRQAQELTQQGQLQYNAQDLASAIAQQREMMDYYTFLENQRNAQNQLNYNYWSRQLAAMGY